MLNSRRGLALQQVDNTKGDKRIRYGGVIVPALGYDKVSFSYLRAKIRSPLYSS